MRLGRTAAENQHSDQRRDLFGGGVALRDLNHERVQRGMLPCLRFGAEALLERSMFSELMRIIRVSRGSITSSTIPRSAAM